ncbi:MAG: Trm112 family protein [candidate division Zixibacteria bacterium]|nr:Trm112 family protein [candidate division Zixibacteria bacterium]
MQNVEGTPVELSEKLLGKLVCPKCKGKLEYREDENRLICQACRLAYHITDGIPVMLIDESEEL